jgi:dissimilatory sulfite reductase (desulfoviridin) alpha/beta subunit
LAPAEERFGYFMQNKGVNNWNKKILTSHTERNYLTFS